MSASDALKSLLGSELLSKSGMVKTTEVLSDKKLVMIYFSAHWCPPCRGFTPKLMAKYNASAAAKSVEIVFVSSDRDEAAFSDYYSEMPWLAVPFEDRDRKASLSAKYGVRGIPSLIVVDADGNLVTTKGRSELDQYLGDSAIVEGAPLKGIAQSDPASLIDIFGEELLSKSGQVKTAEAFDGKQLVMIYFSAHWCPPCRSFTPLLAQKYRAGAKARGIEVIFVSSDQDNESFMNYHSEMPWLAVPFADRARAQLLGQKYGVRGIPSLIVLDASGNLVTTEGRAEVNALFGAASSCCTIS
eukprot:CAMPEP_0197703390 /NCGR_PEP_ID=MMETSP1338-20131121/125414_1 /TAXON_ID=43686 ORGANISM="Pelagodinium beii, Strain RCC1491" /NCGR_SAMPLE_ID=MMETSP1338 /ASSEMBLY_ACC=CAM_ASM_000754 /LENGTH=299 /DNA_ID=CAMNT_0043287285 /DNA_START=83 /DNA_END=982 /DNA_ORIENTATION=+